MSTKYYLQQYASKTLDGAITDSQTSGITLNNATGLDSAKPGIVAVTWSSPLDLNSVEWITYTSINGSFELVGATRGEEGSSAKAHLNGAVVAFVLSESHVNNLAIDLTAAETSITALGESAIEIIIDGGGAELPTGVALDLEIPYDCTINGVKALADQSGSVVVDIWKDTYANYPPTDADTITASAPVTITTATKSEDTTLTGWTVALTEGDVLRVNVDSVTTITRVTVSLDVTKS